MNTLLIQRLSLFQFKNYEAQAFDFHPQLNAIVGANGIGKTNLLDAIYTLSLTKSCFAKNDAALVQHRQQGLRLEGFFQINHQDHNVVFLLRENLKKEIIHNHQTLKTNSDIIGFFPTIMIEPDDILLINDYGEVRRKYINKLIAQLDPIYLDVVMRYHKIIQQKHALLKMPHPRTQHHLLDVYNDQLKPLAEQIYHLRHHYLQLLIQRTIALYHDICANKNTIDITYESQLQSASWDDLKKQFQNKEIQFQKTLFGVHKDDLVFKINHHLFKEGASQGQKKSLLLALKLAEIELIKNKKQMFPIVLLDDIFEKLDDERLHHFFALLQQFQPMQIFLTDVNKDRVSNQLKTISQDFGMFQLG